jgi:putative ABC transport system ATP-binding protein
LSRSGTGPDAGAVLRGAVRGQRRGVIPAALMAIGHQLSEAAVPVVVGVALDRAVGTGNGSALVVWLAVVVGVFVVLLSCGSIGYWILDRARFRAARDLRVRVAARVLDAAGGAPGRPGEQVGLASSDADRTAQYVTAGTNITSSIAALVAGTAVLLSASPVLALAVVVGVPMVLLVSQLLARPLVGRAEAEQDTLAAATSAATDLVSGLRVVKGIGAEAAAAAAYARASQTALRARLHAATAEGGHRGATTALTGLFLVVVAWLGGRLALDGAISIGELVAAVGLAQFLLEPMERITRLGPQIAGSRGAAGRIATFLHAPPAVTVPEPVEGRSTADLRTSTSSARILDDPVQGHLEVRHRSLAIDLAAGEHLGVVVTDAGTAADLLDVLARDAEPDGVLRLDGTDLRSVTLDAARRAVLVARHDAALFEGTLADNLLTEAERDEASLLPALVASAADEVRDTMPDGLGTEIGERGRTLSGGQRQRVALARALAAEPTVLVLHDPTTAIDAATEDRIAAGLDRHRAGSSTLLVTSSPALLARCDRVLLIRDGVIMAEGSHARLVDNPAYRAAVLS